MNTPILRFKEFADEWQAYKLKDFTTPIKRKNINNECKLPLTISSLDGLVDQRTYFNKVIASKNMSNYYLLKNGEFAYNKSYSVGFPFGSIKRLDKYDQGTLSSFVKFTNKRIFDYYFICDGILGVVFLPPKKWTNTLFNNYFSFMRAKKTNKKDKHLTCLYAKISNGE